MFGVDLGAEDPYVMDGVPRPLAKLAFNILLNANSEQAAILALQRELRGSTNEPPRQRAYELVEAVKKRHPNARIFAGRQRRVVHPLRTNPDQS